MDKINIPYTISRQEREEIEAFYLDSVENADREKVDYIKKNLPRVLNRLSKSKETWHVELFLNARHLLRLIGKDSPTPRTARKEIVAALHYLCNPLEVIPDHVAGRGYADDALVVNKCITRLKKLGL